MIYILTFYLLVHQIVVLVVWDAKKFPHDDQIIVSCGKRVLNDVSMTKFVDTIINWYDVLHKLHGFKQIWQFKCVM